MPFLRAALLKKKAEPEPKQGYVLLSPLVEEQPELEEEFEPTRIEELHRLIDIRTEEAEREELGTEAEPLPEYEVVTVEVTPLIEEEVPEFEPEPEIIDAEITDIEVEPEPELIVETVEPAPQEETLSESEPTSEEIAELEEEVKPEPETEPEPEETIEPEEELSHAPEISAEEIAEPEEELSSEEIAEPETENDTEEFTGTDEIVPVPEDNGGDLDVLEVQEEEPPEQEAGIEGVIEETAEENQPEEEPETIAEEITEQEEASLPEIETSAEEITEQDNASLPETETVTEEVTEPETEPTAENTDELESDIIPENDNEADFDENALMDKDASLPQSDTITEEVTETETEAVPETEPDDEDKEPTSTKDYSGSQLNYDFTSGERYVDKVSTKTEFDKMLDELSAISKDLLSWEAEKFAKKYTDKFEDGDSPVADARKFEAFLGGYITNAAMLLYDLGYKDAAIKQLEQAISILQARKKLEDETSAIKSRVEEQNDAVDLSDILGLFGDG